MRHFVIDLVQEASTDTPAKSRIYLRFGKRLFDVFLAIILLPIVGPIIVLLWSLIRLTNGPGFFCQKRIGRNGQPFNFWKFRTMVPNAGAVLQVLCDKDPALKADWQRNQKLERDPRITRLGRYLRASSLDEVPQIWNVLLGDMSFVGPRPFMASQEPLYRAAGGKAYFGMRPGITGPWQISDRGRSAFLGRIQFDNEYTSSAHFWGDIGLMIKTAIAVIKHTGR